jgi:hypothetical protein
MKTIIFIYKNMKSKMEGMEIIKENTTLSNIFLISHMLYNYLLKTIEEETSMGMYVLLD